MPVTRGGKLFATVYILVAGTILLNNMSLISMIPLELRKRRIERAVLTQFGDQLDDDALRELAGGPLVQRLHLATNRPDSLHECTREMFSLAMMVRLGKVTEEDIRDCFAAFRRLDVYEEGVLNSKTIIGGMVQKRWRDSQMVETAGSSTFTPFDNLPSDQGSWYPSPDYSYNTNPYYYSPHDPENGIMLPSEHSALLDQRQQVPPSYHVAPPPGGPTPRTYSQESPF